MKAARYFINFLCRSDIASRNMDEIGYVSAVGTQDLFEMQEDEESYSPIDVSYFFGEDADSVCLNPVQYPDISVIRRCAMMHDSGDRTEQLLGMWSRVKGDNASPMTAIIIGVALIFLTWYGIAKKRKKHRRHTW